MTEEHGSSPNGTAKPVDDAETSPAGEGPARSGRLAAIRRRAHRYLARWRSMVATTLVIAAVGVAAGVYFFLYRPDQQVGDAAARRAIQAASDGATAALSYSYEHLNRDFNNAKSHLTGDFLTYYSKFAEEGGADGAEGATDGQRQGDSGRGLGIASQFGHRAGFHRPDHGKREKERSREDAEQHPGHDDKSRRFLADLEIRPGGVSPADLVLTVTGPTEAV